MVNAGNDFCNGSLTLTCIDTAPIIRKVIAIAAGLTNQGIHIPIIRQMAKRIFTAPIKTINPLGNPSAANSSFIFLASPPRQLVSFAIAYNPNIEYAQRNDELT